nr:MAG: hypothetical protein [Bacteriophage sp.]
MRKGVLNMYRLNYKTNNVFESKLFDTIEEAYWFAVDNLATEEDREWYYNLCGETFESVVVNPTVDKGALMSAIMRNSIERVIVFYKD